ncbi:MAG: SHIRT domain-containing protein, partial [Anaerococcus vaginalis]|nr:SHIRT domain-containing protein [Anaerococcus vaginalis]
MRKHKLLSLTLATFITLGSIAPAIYSPKLAYAKDIDENDSKINNQQTSESLIKKEDKTDEAKKEENSGVKPQENSEKKVEEKIEKKSEEKLDISSEKNPKAQSSQKIQTRGAEESQVEGSLSVSSVIIEDNTEQENKKLVKENWIPTGSIAELKVELKASNKGNAKEDEKIEGLNASISIPRKDLDQTYFSNSGYQILGGQNLKITDNSDENNIKLEIKSDQLQVGTISSFRIRIKTLRPELIDHVLHNPKIKHGSSIDIKGVLKDKNGSLISDKTYKIYHHALTNYIIVPNTNLYPKYLKADSKSLNANKKSLVDDETKLEKSTWWIKAEDRFFAQKYTGVYLPEKVKLKLYPKKLEQGKVVVDDKTWTKDSDGSYYKMVEPKIIDKTEFYYTSAQTGVDIKLPGFPIGKEQEIFESSVVMVDESGNEIPGTESKRDVRKALYKIEEERPPKVDDKLDLRSEVTVKNTTGDYDYAGNKDKVTNWQMEIKNTAYNNKNPKENLYLGKIYNFQMTKNFYATELSFDTNGIDMTGDNKDITYTLSAFNTETGKLEELGSHSLKDVVKFDAEKYRRPEATFNKAIEIKGKESLKMNLKTKVFGQDYDNFTDQSKWKLSKELNFNDNKTLTNEKLNVAIAGEFYLDKEKSSRVEGHISSSSNLETSNIDYLVINALLGLVNMYRDPDYYHQKGSSGEFIEKNTRVTALTGDTVRMDFNVNFYLKNKSNVIKKMLSNQKQYLKNPRFLIQIPSSEETLDVKITVQNDEWGTDRTPREVKVDKEIRGGKGFYVVHLDDPKLDDFISDYKISCYVKFKDSKRPEGINGFFWMIYDNYGKDAFLNSGREYKDKYDLNKNNIFDENFLMGRYSVEYGSAFKVVGSTAAKYINEKNGKQVEEENFNFRNVSNMYELNTDHTLGLRIENKLKSAINSLRIIDVLPNIGDKMQISGQDRNSGTKLSLTGPIEVDRTDRDTTIGDDVKFEITYSTDQPNNLANNLNATFKTDPGDWSKVTMFQIKILSGNIASGKNVVFKVPVKSDTEENSKPSENGVIYSGNSFAYAASINTEELNDPSRYVETFTNYQRYEINRKIKYEKGDAKYIVYGNSINADEKEYKVKNGLDWKEFTKNNPIPSIYIEVGDSTNIATNNYKWLANDDNTRLWLDGKDITVIDSKKIDKDLTFEAKQIVKKEDPKDNRYVKVTFKSTDNGKFDQNKKEISYWVLKGTKFDDALKLEEYKTKNEKIKVIEIPKVTSNVGEHKSWTIGEKDYNKELSDYTDILNSDIEIVAKYEIKTVGVKYKFESSTEGKRLPEGVTKQLNDQDLKKEGKVGDTVKAPSVRFNPVADDEGTWNFDQWAPKDLALSLEASKNEFVGKWKWTKKEYTKDKIIPYLPTEEEPKKGNDGKEIPKNYITVTFKSEDINKGKVKVGDKEGKEVKAKVEQGTDLSKLDTISTKPADDYGFTKWDPQLGVAKDGNTYTAYFIKSGD